jgi:hypothetical protein
MIQKKMQTFMKLSHQMIKRTMKNLLAKNLHILSMPCMKRISHIQGKNIKNKFINKATKSLERSKNHLMVPLKTTKIQLKNERLKE